MKTNPLISVIIPVYNGANFLGEAIESVLLQTYKNYEIIVVNDGSTDEGATEILAKKYIPRIRYFSKENGGVASALNYGINKMKGEYFSWLSHDDVYYPYKFQVEVDELKKINSNVILYGMWDLIDKKSKHLGRGGGFNVNPNRFHISIINSYPIHGCATLIPKCIFDEVGHFNTEFKLTNDYEMWFRLSSSFSFRFIPQSLAKIRLHNGQGSITKKDYLNEVDNLGCYYLSQVSKKELINAYPEISLNKIYWQLAKHYLGLMSKRTPSNIRKLELSLLKDRRPIKYFKKIGIDIKYLSYTILMYFLNYCKEILLVTRDSKIRIYIANLKAKIK